MTSAEFTRLPGMNTFRGLRPGTANSSIAFLGYAVHNNISTRWQITNPYKNMITVINHGVTEIGNNAFDNHQLVRVIIPNSVTNIRDYAFIRNPLAFVSIGANVNIAYNSSFPDGLYYKSFYDGNGRLAGTYMYDYINKKWTYSP